MFPAAAPLYFLKHPLVINVLELGQYIGPVLLLTIVYVNVSFQALIIVILTFLRRRSSFMKYVCGGRPGIVV